MLHKTISVLNVYFAPFYSFFQRTNIYVLIGIGLSLFLLFVFALYCLMKHNKLKKEEKKRIKNKKH